jgi:outer membrane receptor protein involved in Fe transport
MIGQYYLKKMPWGVQISLLLWMFVVAESRAVTDAKANPRVERLLEQVVTVATRQPADALSVNGSISNVSDDELRLVGHAHVQESLNRAAGVNLNRGNGQEYLPAVRSPVMTGAGGCGGFLMTEDGIPLRAAGFCNINELFEAHTEAAERLEILRGSGTALYGSNAMHGVINVVTPNATAPDRLGLDFGEHGYARVRFSLGGGEQHKFALRGTWRGMMATETMLAMGSKKSAFVMDIRVRFSVSRVA